MAKKKVASELNVYLNNLHLGVLEYKTKKLLTFRYSEDWLQRKTSFPISRSLPLQEDSFKGEEVFAYFDNLLPDSSTIRQRIAARMHANSDQVYDLLAVVGRDCVGALQFAKADEFKPATKPKGTEVSDKEIAARLRNLSINPLAASADEDFRLSIAGAQEKTAFLKLNGKWHIPHNATPSTHIFKPQIGAIRPGFSFSDSVENEWLCGELARAFGLPVAKSEIAEFEEIKVLVVERFDRSRHKSQLIRIPQEDICQALSVPSFEKYQSDGGPGIHQVMELLNESQKPSEDRALFMKTQVVFLLLAAIDGHAKNFSIRWGPAGFFLTPLYDILSAQPIVDRGELEYQKIKMAMSIGDNSHWKVKEISRRHFLQSAKRCRFDLAMMNQIIDETIESVPKAIDAVANYLPPGFPEDVADSIFKGMRARVRPFRT